MRITEGIGISSGIAVTIVGSGFIDFNFKGFAFFCFFGVELSASLSGDDEKDDTGNDEHSADSQFSLVQNTQSKPFSRNTNTPTITAGTTLRRILLVGLSHAAELGSDSSQARR